MSITDTLQSIIDDDLNTYDERDSEKVQALRSAISILDAVTGLIVVVTGEIQRRGLEGGERAQEKADGPGDEG